MQLTLGRIYNSLEALGKLSEKALPVTTAFKVARLVSALEAPLKDADLARANLLRQVGEQIEGTQQYKIHSPEVWRAELEKLLEQEIDIPAEKLTLTDFGKIEVEPSVISRLSWLVEI